jgi:hypothetical protein
MTLRLWRSDGGKAKEGERVEGEGHGRGRDRETERQREREREREGDMREYPECAGGRGVEDYQEKKNDMKSGIILLRVRFED